MKRGVLNGREEHLKKDREWCNVTRGFQGQVKSRLWHSRCVGAQEAAGVPVGTSSDPGQTRALSAHCVTGNFS